LRRIEAIGERRGTAAQCAFAYCALRALALHPRNLRANRRNPYYIGVTAEPEGTFILLTKTPTDTSAAAPQQIISGPPELETGGVLFIDLNAIVFNWRSLMQRAVPADCAAVVKADAYGCGIEPVSAELAKGGCRTFFVAHLAEARQVRAAAPQAVIYVLNGIAPGSAPTYAAIDAVPVIGTMAEFVEWDAFRRASGWLGGAALHFDTGMNRLGLSINEAPALAARVKMPDHGIALIMTHLACAETPGHDLNNAQTDAFRQLRYLFRGIAASLANSSGIFLGPAAQCGTVRRQSDTGLAKPSGAGRHAQGPHRPDPSCRARCHCRLRRRLDRSAGVARRHRLGRLW
jgi:hypothetical protein